MARPVARPKPPKAAPKPPRHTTPIEVDPDGTPARTSNGPRPQDPKQTASQNPAIDYAPHSSPAHLPLGADEEV